MPFLITAGPSLQLSGVVYDLLLGQAATFTFTGATTGTFTYTVSGTSGTKTITRQIFGTPATVCRP